MSVKIRLKKVGRTHNRIFRIVVVNEQAKRDGKVLAELGTYAPKSNPSVTQLNETDLKEWLKRGAIPTDIVRKICKI